MIGAALSVAAVITPIAVAAIAAAPVKGASYAGTIKQGNIPISFKVSNNGKKVSKLNPQSLPLFCEGGGGPTVLKVSNAAVDKKGAFTTTGRETANGKIVATVKITGKFQSGGREKGKLKVTYQFAKDCNGSTTYTTQAE